jgi:hypothetical protein
MGRLLVVRPHARRKGFQTSEWLAGSVSRSDAADEATALLTDPRDTITGVYFWDDRHAQFDGKWIRTPSAS